MRADFVRAHKLYPTALILAGSAAIGAAIIYNNLHGARPTGFSDRQFVLLFIGISLVFWGGIRVGPLKRLSLPNEAEKSKPTKWIDILGSINLVCFAAYALLSYGLTPQLPFGTSQPQNAEYYRRLVQLVSLLGPDAQAFVAGHSILSQPIPFLIAYSLPLVISSFVFLTLLVALAHYRNGLTPNAPNRLLTWAAASAFANIVASPVLVHDFWYPLAWGRMIAVGVNPYYVNLTNQFTHGLALNAGHERMMYGPLLAIISGAVMWLAGSQALLGAAIFKLLLGAAWIGSLWLISQLLRERPLWCQCVGIATFGWLPISVVQAVGDGHSDVIMMFFLLLWLYCSDHEKRILGSLALAASVAIKYVTAPVFALDLAYCLLIRRYKLSQYLPSALAAAAFLAIAFSPFFRSMAFFAPLWPRTQWHFFAMRDAVIAIVIVLGRYVPVQVAQTVQGLFPLIALYFAIEYIRRPGRIQLRVVLLAVMAALLFGYISGIWPWYLIWVLAPAALVPESILARWTQGVALVAPFSILVWNVFPHIDPFFIFSLPALGIYLFAGMWIIFAPREWFPISEPTNARPTPRTQEYAPSLLDIAAASAEARR